MNGDRIIRRARGIFDYLLTHLNDFVPGDQLRTDLNAKLKDSVDKQAYRAAAFYLKNSMCPYGYDVHVSTKHGFKLEQIDPSRYMQRSVEHPDLKMGLGYALWDWLLNIRPHEDPEFEHKPKHYQEMVAVKLASLRARSMISVIADAGSTVSFAIRALLDVGVTTQV